MDAFSKIRKSAGREELKRQMINKAIDLLHKLANKRIEYGDARSEISRVVSEYYVIDESVGVKSADKINLELMINNAFDVIEGVREEKLNLYQAIMLMNKVMAHSEGAKTAEKKEEKVALVETEKEKKDKVEINEPEMEMEIKEPKVEVRMEKEVKALPKGTKEDETFSILMNNVIENKRKLHDSIEELNDVLKAHGFTLSTLDPK